MQALSAERPNFDPHLPPKKRFPVRNSEFIFFVQHETIIESREGL